MDQSLTDYLVESLPTFTGCDVTPLLDGAEYTAALRDALDKVDRPGQFVLLTGWWLGLARGGFELVPAKFGNDMRLIDAPPFCLDPWPDGKEPFQDPPDESSALLELLAEKVRAGVDVWALGWVSPLALRMSRLSQLLGGAHAVAINTLTARSLRALRAAGAHALPSTIGHLAGSMHSKTALVCDGRNTVGFTGGLDLELSRWSRPDHAGRQIWHDVMARVEGPAVQSIYDHFRMLWEANRVAAPQTFKVDGEPMVSVPADTRAMPARVVPVLPTQRNLRVQALRTLPAARYGWPARKRLPEATFSYRDALKKAIGAASTYVYVEDPLLWSTEVMGWLNEALLREPGLRVVIVTGGLEDPNDPPLPHAQYLCAAINDSLLVGVDTDRMLAFRRTGVVVHAKTVVVDDTWACIGSCNIARRSLYTDIEHGIAFVDPDGDQVARYRARLWAHHLGVDPSTLADLPAALDALGKRPGRLAPLPSPVPDAPLTRRGRRRYDTADDPDSRQRWVPRLF